MAVITISRQTESLGTEIAQEVADKLHYEYLDKEGIAEGLTAYGLAVPEVEKFDEKSHPFWVNWQIQGRKFFRAIKTVIYQAARKDNVVIVGRGWSGPSQGDPRRPPRQDHCPRFRIASSASGHVTGATRANRREYCKQDDRDSGGFIRGLFRCRLGGFGPLRSHDQYTSYSDSYGRRHDPAGGSCRRSDEGQPEIPAGALG